jgi:HIP---CoA ligase
VAELVDRTGAALVVVEDGFLGRTQIADLRAASTLDSVRDVIDLRYLQVDVGDVEAHDVTLDEVELRADAVSPDDVADILFTSGTTGRPKGAMSAHRQTVGVARVWGELGGVTADDRYLVINPFFHSFGYKAGIVVGLTTGATLYPLRTFDLDETMRLIQEERITVLPGAPTIYQSLLSAPQRHDFDLSSLRLAVTGAAVVPVVLIERMRAREPDGLGIDHVVTAFGMTEAVVATMCREGDSAETVATTCGRAVPGMEARIAEAGDAEADDSGAGELLLRGEYVMLGYLDDPDATAEAIDPDGWLHTGDIGTLDEHGNLSITDRLKDMYISGGFNVYPAEVEQTLMRLDGVQDVAVVGVTDERMGEVGKAFVVGDVSADDVLAFARERLANFKVPRAVELVDALPRNLGGKVLKNELRDRSKES